LENGAVSAQTARSMAAGCSASFDGALAVAVTGIAGPGGGTQNKPVGLVYIATAIDKDTKCYNHHFQGDRHSIREQTIEQALNHLLTRINTM